MSTESPMDALVDTNNTSDSYEGTWFEGKCQEIIPS